MSPDYLRFDFSHHEALTREQLDEVEALANLEIIGDAPVRHYETTKDHAESLGAIAFFGDKYGDLVRVLEAGEHSIELCGGTHVHALGFIGPIKITSEASIGANLRRIFAVTGDAALARIHDEEVQLRELADSLKVSPAELPERVARLVGQVQELQDELAAERSKQAGAEGVDARRAAPPTASWSSPGVTASAATSSVSSRSRRATRSVTASSPLVGLGPDGDEGRSRGRASPRTSSPRACRRPISPATRRGARRGHGEERRAGAGGGPNVDAVDDAARAPRGRRGRCAASERRLREPGPRRRPRQPSHRARRHRSRRTRSPARSRCSSAATTPSDDHRAILAAAREIGAKRIVVGLPVSLDGRQGPAARRCSRRSGG